MPIETPEPLSKAPASVGRDSLAEELRRESERLRALAELLKKRESELTEMIENYPYFRRFVYDKLREQFAKSVPELPEGVDLREYAEAHGGLPLDAFIHELELDDEGPAT